MLGAIVSDGLDDGKVVSGVGGQYNFVAQAFALDDARSIICVNATRTSGGSTSSNIIWNYGHTTIPRHLRDIVVTEYGIADLRGKSDAQVAAAMLSIADSRFQPELLRKAKDAGKIAKNYEIPAAHRNNTPERIILALSSAKERGLLPDFPFGTDFNETEQRLVPALQTLKTASASPLTLLRLAMRGFSAKENEKMREALTRVQLDAPTDLRGKLYRMLLKGALV
ncbi:MAG TPA: acetyl-CoA hydrolase/transferase C-terminal domain-containing protein, partial [Xanthobacteraceae bacterium]|nr:acetyl-CoA hydrolase/transferase C-terminal domain-containing protein [Xanthobacteraceae bacterium]